MDAALKRHVVPLLRKLGFKGSYPHFRRILNERVDTVGFQFSQWGPQFYVEIGVADPNGYTLLDGTHFPPSTLKYYQCPVRVRIGGFPFDFEELPADTVAVAVRKSIDVARSDWANLDRNRPQPKGNDAELSDAPNPPNGAF